MRLNQYVAKATGMSRRAADQVIEQGRVSINGVSAVLGQQITDSDKVTIDNAVITLNANSLTIILNKPVGYVCSRNGQGKKTIYELLPPEYHKLKPVGRLDKDSSGLLLMTNDGQLAYELTHPKFEKLKKYKIALNKDLTAEDYKKITQLGVTLEDGLSKFTLEPINNQNKEWKVTMREGRNRQIRRTFEYLGYAVVKLHRTHFGPYSLNNLGVGVYRPTSVIS